MEVSDQLHAPAALPRRKSLGYPFMGGWVAPEPVWTQWRREKYSSPYHEWNPGHPACSLVAIVTEILVRYT